jgi:hypothetical protein
LKDRLIWRVDHVFELCACRFEPPGETIMNRRAVIDAEEEENGNRDCPDTAKTVLHGRDYKTKRP